MEGRSIFPQQRYSNISESIQINKVLQWATALLYLSGFVILAQLAINIARFVLYHRYLVYKLPANAHEMLRNGIIDIVIITTRSVVLCFGFVALYRLKRFYRTNTEDLLRPALSAIKLYYITGGILLVLDILLYSYYFTRYAKLILQYPL